MPDQSYQWRHLQVALLKSTDLHSLVEFVFLHYVCVSVSQKKEEVFSLLLRPEAVEIQKYNEIIFIENEKTSSQAR